MNNSDKKGGIFTKGDGLHFFALRKDSGPITGSDFVSIFDCMRQQMIESLFPRKDISSLALVDDGDASQLFHGSTDLGEPCKKENLPAAFRNLPVQDIRKNHLRTQLTNFWDDPQRKTWTVNASLIAPRNPLDKVEAFRPKKKVAPLFSNPMDLYLLSYAFFCKTLGIRMTPATFKKKFPQIPREEIFYQCLLMWSAKDRHTGMDRGFTDKYLYILFNNFGINPNEELGIKKLDKALRKTCFSDEEFVCQVLSYDPSFAGSGGDLVRTFVANRLIV